MVDCVSQPALTGHLYKFQIVYTDVVVCFGLFCVLFNASHLSLPGYGGFKVPNDDAGFCKKLKEKHLERGKTHLGAEITNTRHEYVKLLCSGKGRYLLIYPHVALKCVLR